MAAPADVPDGTETSASRAVGTRPLPGMEVVRTSLTEPDGYLCSWCWRRIPVGQRTHACFFWE